MEIWLGGRVGYTVTTDKQKGAEIIDTFWVLGDHYTTS